MSNRAEGGRPSWRGSDGGSPQKPSGSSQSWRRTSGSRGPSPLDVVGSPIWKRRFRAFMAALSSILAGGLIVYLVGLPGCTKTEFIIATTVSYKDCRIPHPVFAKRDAEALEQAGAMLNGRRVARISTPDELVRHRKTVGERASEQSVVVMYVSGHGGLFVEGGDPTARSQTAGILWKDLPIDEPKGKTSERPQFLTLIHLLDELKQLPARQHKLLLLDPGPMHPQWRLGLLGNWFGDELEEQMRGISNLTVMMSAAPGERSWGGAHLGDGSQGRSAFGHFVATGLSGEADSNRDRRLTCRELCKYVSDNTNAWVWQNRDTAGQHPLILSRDPAYEANRYDVYITLSSSAAAPKPAAATEKGKTGKAAVNLATVWNDLDSCWADYAKLSGQADDVLRVNAAYQYDPIRWRALMHCLMSAEQFRRDNAAEPAKPLIVHAKSLLVELRKSVDSDVLRAYANQPFIQDHVIQRMLSGQPAEARPDNTVLLPENHLKQVFINASSGNPPELPAQYAVVKDPAIQLRRLAEQVACGPLGTRYLVSPLIGRGDQLRRKAEDGLFVRAAVDQMIQQCQTQATNNYQQAQDLQQTWHQVRCLRNRLLAQLPELAVWVAFRATEIKAERRDVVVRLLQKAINSATDGLPKIPIPELRQLADSSKGLDAISLDLLVLFHLKGEFDRKLNAWGAMDDSGENALKSVPEAQVQIKAAGESLARIEQAIRLRADELRKAQKQPQPPNWRDLADLLACPELPPNDRERLNGVLAEYSRKLQEGIKVADIEKAPSKPATDSRADLARWHGLWAILTLSRGLEGASEEVELWSYWNKLPPSNDNVEFKGRATELGDRLRRAFIENQTQLAKSLVIEAGAGNQLGVNLDAERRQRDTADRQARHYVDQCAALEVAGMLKPLNNPTLRWRQYQMEHLLLALSEQYLQDYWNGWYDMAVDECLKGAASERLGAEVRRERIEELKQSLEARQQALFEVRGETVVFGSYDDKKLPVTITGRGLPPGDVAFWMDLKPNQGLSLSPITRFTIPLLERTTPMQDRQTLEFDLRRDPPPSTVVSRSVVTPRIFYRGHTWDQKIKAIAIDAKRPAGIQFVSIAPRPLGKVIVEGEHRPTILFILDCSGSMSLTKDGKEPKNGEKSRIDGARTAFSATLQQLANQQGNNACDVGVLVYVGAKDNQGVRVLSPIAPLTPQLQAQIVAAWEALQPNGVTPLYAAIVQACDLLNNRPGSTIVAITDGIDGQRANPDVAFQMVNNRLNIARMKDNLNFIMIELDIDVAALKLDDQKTGDNQVLRHSFMTQLAGAGRVPVQGGNQLQEALINAVRVRPYQIARLPLNRSVRPLNGLFGKETDNLAPGMYQAQFEKVWLDFQIVGDEFIELRADQSRILHHKPKLNGLELGGSTIDRKLQLGYYSYKVGGKPPVAEFVLALTHRDETACVPRPAEIDFEVNPVDEPRVRPMETKIVPDQTIPTWKVTVQDWPGKSEAQIQAVWKEVRTPPDQVLSFQDFAARRELTFEGSENGKVTLDLIRPEFDSQNAQVRFVVRLADFKPQNTAANVTLLNDLRQMRFELQPTKSKTGDVREFNTRREFTTRREFIKDDGSLSVEIDIPDDIPQVKSQEGWSILITSRKSLRTNATKTQLTIRKVTDEL